MFLTPTSVPSLFKPEDLLSVPRTRLKKLGTPCLPQWLNWIFLCCFLTSPSIWSVQPLLPQTVTDTKTPQSSSSTGLPLWGIFFLTLLLPSSSLPYFLTSGWPPGSFSSPTHPTPLRKLNPYSWLLWLFPTFLYLTAPKDVCLDASHMLQAPPQNMNSALLKPVLGAFCSQVCSPLPRENSE